LEGLGLRAWVSPRRPRRGRMCCAHVALHLPATRMCARRRPASRFFAAPRHECDNFFTPCLPKRHFGPILQMLMIISTLRVGPWGPLFLFWVGPLSVRVALPDMWRR